MGTRDDDGLQLDCIVSLIASGGNMDLNRNNSLSVCVQQSPKSEEIVLAWLT